jgi:predicted ATPase
LPNPKDGAAQTIGLRDKGIELQQEGMSSLHSIGSMFWTTGFRARLAESYLEIGELDHAEANLDAAFAHLQSRGEMFFAVELHRLKLLLCAGRAPSSALDDIVPTGLNMARCQGARFLELRLATCDARLWRQQGRRTEARKLLAPLYGSFTEGFDTADLKEAKRLLDELT